MLDCFLLEQGNQIQMFIKITNIIEQQWRGQKPQPQITCANPAVVAKHGKGNKDTLT